MAQLLLSSGARTDSSEVLSRFPPPRVRPGVEERGKSPLPDGGWVVRGSWGLLKAEVRLGDLLGGSAWSWVQGCAGTALTTGSGGEGCWPRFVVFAYFCGVNNPPVLGFKLLMWQH